MLAAWCNAEGEAGNSKSIGSQTGVRYGCARDFSSGPGDIRQNPARLLRRYRVGGLLQRFQPSSQMHDSREAELLKLRQRAPVEPRSETQCSREDLLLSSVLRSYAKSRAGLREAGEKLTRLQVPDYLNSRMR